MAKIDMAFGLVLKKHRENQGLTQEQLAGALDISRATVVYYEHGRQSPSLDVAVKIAQFLNFDLNDVITESKSMSDSMPLELRSSIESNLQKLVKEKS